MSEFPRILSGLSTPDAWHRPITRRTLGKVAGGIVAASAVASLPFLSETAEAATYVPDSAFIPAAYTPGRYTEWGPIFDATARFYGLLQMQYPGGPLDRLAKLTQIIYPHRDRPENALQGAQRIANALVNRDRNDPTKVGSDGFCQALTNLAIIDPNIQMFTDDNNILGTGIGFDYKDKQVIGDGQMAACVPMLWGGIDGIAQDYLIGTNGNPPNRKPFGVDVSQVRGAFWGTWIDGVTPDGKIFRGKNTLSEKSVQYTRDQMVSISDTAWRPELRKIDFNTQLPVGLNFVHGSELESIWFNDIKDLYNWGIDWDVVAYLFHRTPLPTA